MKKTFLYSSIVCLVFTALRVKAQKNDTVFTLKSCVEYSLKNNLNCIIYTNEVLIAKEKKTEVLANMMPQVNAQLSMDNNIKRQVTVFPANSFGPNTPESRTQIGSKLTANGTVQIDQSLYDHSMFLAIGATKINRHIAELKVQQNNESLIYNTASAYYQVLTITEQKKLLLENANKYNNLLSIMKLQYEKGLVKKVDYDRIRVNINNIKSQITVIEMNELLALNKLKNEMGMELTQTLNIVDSIDTKNTVLAPKSEIYNSNNKVEYQILNQNHIIQEIDVKRKIAAFYPSLSTYVRFGSQALANDFNQTNIKWDDFSAIGLKLSIPIFSGFRRVSQLSQSKLTLKNIQENLKLIDRNYQLQFQNSSTQLLSSYKTLVLNKENLDLAKEVLETSQLQYEKGAATLSDYLNSDYSYKEAQNNYIISLLNYLTGKLDYEKAQGTLSTYLQQL